MKFRALFSLSLLLAVALPWVHASDTGWQSAEALESEVFFEQQVIQLGEIDNERYSEMKILQTNGQLIVAQARWRSADFDIVGRVQTFERDGSGNWVLDQTLYPLSYNPDTGSGRSSRYGASVAVSEDGRWMAVGATNDQGVFANNAIGYVYIYRRVNPSADWVYWQALMSPVPSTEFGKSVAFLDNYLAVGAPFQGNAGYIHTFQPGNTGTLNQFWNSTPQHSHPGQSGDRRAGETLVGNGAVIAAPFQSMRQGAPSLIYWLVLTQPSGQTFGLHPISGFHPYEPTYDDISVALSVPIPDPTDGDPVFSVVTGSKRWTNDVWTLTIARRPFEPGAARFSTTPWEVSEQKILESAIPVTNLYEPFREVAVNPDGLLVAVSSGRNGQSSQGQLFLFEDPAGDNNHIYGTQLEGSQSQTTFNNFGLPIQFGEDASLYVGHWADPAKLYEFDASYANGSPAIAQHFRNQLYPADAEAAGSDPAEAAFDYLDAMYAQGTALPTITPDLADDAFDAQDEEILRSILAALDIALTAAPGNEDYGHLLLDLFYDWSRAKTIQAVEMVAETERIRLDAPPEQQSNDGRALILPAETAAYNQALALQRGAVDTWMCLLTDPIGDDAGTPAGFTALSQLGAARTLAPAYYVDIDTDERVSVTGNDDPILAGYKDLVYILEALADEAVYAAELGYLIALTGDEAAALAVIAETERRVSTFSRLAREPLKNATPTAAQEEALGQGEADLHEARMRLVDVRELVTSELNILGFHPDFLPLVPKTETVTDLIHTFDKLRERLAPTSPFPPIIRATDSQQTALDEYDDYQNNADEVALELVDIDTTFNQRLDQIIGTSGIPPEDNPATEIYQQVQNVERARQRIARNNTEISNLLAKVDIEVERRGQERNINNAKQRITIQFGNAQASLTEQIGYIEGMQKVTDSIAGVGNPVEYVTGLIAGAASGVSQIAISDLQAQKERLAGQEQAALIAQDGLLADANSRALVRTWLLDMNLLVIDSLDAAIVMQQEIGRLAALFREKERLEARISLATTNLKNRFFADPIHRYRARHAILIANEDFRRAQEFVFYLIRAYEYKLNEVFDTGLWDLQSFFQIRNARELDRLVAALLVEHDGKNVSLDDAFDWFSVRDNFFGYRPIGDRNDPTDPEHLLPANLYADPITGQSVPYFQAFESQLRLHLRVVDNAGNIIDIPDGADPLTYDNVQLAIPFSTTRQLPGRLFFDQDTYLNKIIAMHVNIVGNHSFSTVSGTLILSGTSFIRNRLPGTPDPADPTRVLNEFSTAPVREWRADQGTWEYEDEQRQRITIFLEPDDRIPPSVLSIDTFNERSVASTNWELIVDIRDSGTEIVDIEDIEDIEIYFHHKYATR